MPNKVMKPIKSPSKLKAFLTLVEKSGEKYYVIAKLQLNTGRRICDIREKRVGDIMQPNMRFREYFVLKEQKTGKGASIRLNGEIRKVLKTYIVQNKLQPDDYLFPGKGGDAAISYQQVWRVFQEAARQLGIENFGTHSLRKTWGYNAYTKTKNIGLLMKAFNHSSVEETLRYIGIDQDEEDELYSIIEL